MAYIHWALEAFGYFVIGGSLGAAVAFAIGGTPLVLDWLETKKKGE